MESDDRSDSFASLFEQSQKPARSRSLRTGETVEAVVVQVGKESVFVELDGKRQAYLDAADLRAPDGTIPLAVGDTITAKVLEIDSKAGTVRLGRSLGRANNLAALEQAREAGLGVEGKVVAVNKGGLEVELGGARGFCPMSQADARFVEDPQTFVGKSFKFLVTDIRDGGKNVVVSRRALLEREAKENARGLLATLTPGAVVRGTVTGVREFGAFVDLGGIEGMIPASEVSHERGVAIADKLRAGDAVEVQVRDVKDGTNARGEATTKITLSLKALASDPWESAEADLPVGKVVRGTVARTAEFGLFVRLPAGVDGLLHVSEIGGKPDAALRAFSVGQELSVVVKSVDKAARKVSLSPAPDGLAVGASVRPVTVAVGSVVTGTVDRIETYGVFVQLEGTKGRAGRGLIPNAELGIPRGADTRKAFPEGTKVTAKVLETGDGRLRLSIKAAKDAEERADFEGFRDKAQAPGKLGTLGDLLAKRLKK
jgi:small subunit ribosomal protein S1